MWWCAGVLLSSCGGSTPAVASSAAVRSLPPQAAPQEPPAPRTLADAWHVLQRFSFGPRVGEARALVESGIDAWFEGQLASAAIDAHANAKAIADYPLAFMEPLELRHAVWPEDQEQLPTNNELEVPNAPVKRGPLIHDLQGALLTQQVLSEHQLLEVMTDFWLNHFNVSVQKKQVAYVADDYINRVIRPHALGHFEELLIGVATHPAMLIYLDNEKSSVKRPGPKGERGGINENFARELLELHTVSVDAGYSQQDVIEVARILSGWGVEELGFAYRDAQHDHGDKSVMGRQFATGGGYEEGVELLRWLAVHPQTARFVCRKLAQRFVDDNPPPALVERLATTWMQSRGDIPSVLRDLYHSPEFWDSQYRGNKVKTALEWMVSALRMLGVRQVSDPAIRALGRLEQPPLAQPVPTGYPETADYWAQSSQLATRWLLSFRFASGRMPGISPDIRDLLGDEVDPDELAQRLSEELLGTASEYTQQVLREHLAAIAKPKVRRRDALALALAMPEFQLQ